MNVTDTKGACGMNEQMKQQMQNLIYAFSTSEHFRRPAKKFFGVLRCSVRFCIFRPIAGYCISRAISNSI